MVRGISAVLLVGSLLLVQFASARQPFTGDIAPVSCRTGSYVLVGAPFHFELPNGSVVEDGSCTLDGPAVVSNESYTIYTPGEFNYSCSGAGSGQISVRKGYYSVTLCKNCTRGEHVLQLGDALYWSYGEENLACTPVILGPGEPVVEGNFFEPTEEGTYRLYCQENDTISALITVVSAVSSPAEGESDEKWRALLYTHAALMGVVFGILLPIGAFLAHQKVYIAHRIIQPIGLLLALVGLVMVLVYIELSHGKHFHTLHGVVGIVLLAVSLLLMPTLLLVSKVKEQLKYLRTWHRRCGHVVSFFGMGTVLLGLSILPAPLPAALATCIVYGIWLLAAIAVYVILSPRKSASHTPVDLDKTEKVQLTSMNSLQSQSVEPDSESRKGSIFSKRSEMSESVRRGSVMSNGVVKGPQPLSKGIISEEKMVQLRKKSLDFLEARKQREMLDAEYGLSQPPIPEHEAENMAFKPNSEIERQNSKSNLEEEEERKSKKSNSPPLHILQHSPDSASPPMNIYLPQPTFKFTTASGSSDSSDSDEEQPPDKPVPESPTIPIIRTAHSFNCGHTPADRSESDSENDLVRGGSLRLTRHSKRARRTAAGNSPTPSPYPSPRASPRASPRPSPILNNANNTRRPATLERRRKAALVPPIITTTPVDSEESPAIECPFGKKPFPEPSSESRSRGHSPSPSSDSVFVESSPKPRKKVSVAHIEATVFPPTPCTLEPPRLLSRSSSFSNRLRPPEQEAAFVDNALRSVMLMSHEAIICANSSGEIVFWSQSAVKMFGYTPGEAIGSDLSMIIPSNYKEKHAIGIQKRTEDTLKYMKKHSYTPEEQKHARLYEVHGRSKNGHEFPVEVNVTSFVIEGELFYTGVIVELTKVRGRQRANSFSSASDYQEATLKQRALAVGAQMKIAHKLRSAESISKAELERVLSGSLQSTNFPVEPNQMEQMINGIMKAGDPTNTGSINFVHLIQLLSKFRLYISESGLIARYGKTKGAEGNLTKAQRFIDGIKHTFTCHLSFVIWILIYLMFNIVLLLGGVFSSNRQGWERWAYGTGPVLSMNLALVIVPTLSSLINAMRNSSWMNKCFPLRLATLFHLIIVGGIFFWTGVHLLTHFGSFAIDNRNATEMISSTEHFKRNLVNNLFPTVTGFVILTTLLLMALSSVKVIRKQLRFIPFYLLHWGGLVLIYLLLILHGVNYYNPSFWKWLLPAVLVLVLDRLYWYFVADKLSVKLNSAGLYDDISRVGLIEMEKPKGFKFEAGQYIMLRMPWIGYFNWHPCHISSGPKENKLIVYIPKDDDIWFTEVYTSLKANPINRQPNNHSTIKPLLDENIPTPSLTPTIQLSGPYGPGDNSIFDYKISTLVCGAEGPHPSKAIIKKFLEYRKGSSCMCGCHPTLSKLYFVWVIPSGNDFEWFTDYLSDLCEDDHLQRYLDIRVFLTNIDSPPDELASALLQLGLKTVGESCTVRRPSQPQLNNLYQMTSYGLPDFDALLDYIYLQHSNLWNEREVEFGVFSIGDLHHSMRADLKTACITRTKPGQVIFKPQHIIT